MSAPQTTALKNDAVLKIARVIIILGQWLTALAGIAVIVAIPCLFIFSGPILQELSASLVNKPDMSVLFAIAGLLMVALLIVALTYFAIHRLRCIVESVGEGDPFIPENGIRLRGMGLAILAIQALSFITGTLVVAIVAMLGELKPDAEAVLDIDFSLSLSGILLGLLLIVLARVFDHGAAMRDDLEGTV